MTIDEMIKKLRQAKSDGMPGTAQVLLESPWETEEGYDVMTPHYVEPITVRLETESKRPNNRVQVRYGRIVDGRGRPNGTERAVRII